MISPFIIKSEQIKYIFYFCNQTKSIILFINKEFIPAEKNK